MPTRVSTSDKVERQLWTDSDFLPGFWVRREWLNTSQLPETVPCLDAILASAREG